MKHVNWIDDLILPFAVAVLQTAWVSLWLRWADRLVTRADPVIFPAPWQMVALAAGSAYLTHFALGRIESLNRARAAVLASGLAAIALTAWISYPIGFPLAFVRGLVEWRPTVTPQFLGFVAGVYLWSRGILVGRSRIPHQMLEDAFYGGLGALAALLLLNQFTPLVPRLEALWGIVIFFAVGLGTLALASLERARRKQQSLSGALPALSRQWLATVAAVIGAVIFGGLALSGWLAPETFLRAADLVGPYLDLAIYYTLYVLALGAFALGWLLFPVVQWLIERLGQIPLLLNLPEPARFAAEAEAAARAFLTSPGFRVASRSALGLVIAAAVLALFWYALRRFTRSTGKDVEETRESILSGDLLLAQLRSLFARRPAGPGRAADPYLDLGPGDDPRLIIRRAYQGLLAWTRGFTVERRPGQTPAAFAAELAQALPSGENAITMLTGAYERARYAAEPPPLAEAEQARQALEQLKSLGRPARLAPTQDKGAA